MAAPARRSAFLLPALALAVGLVGYTCAPSSEYDDYSAYSAEMGQATEAHQNTSATSVTSTTHAQYEPLTPSQYIRDFVESVFRGEADAELDSGESLRPKELSMANPGFNQYWPQGEWAVKKADIEFCNTSADACSVLYKNYGQLCASNMRDQRDTFDTWCELNDDNCRDGTAMAWTDSGFNTEGIKWFRVTTSPIFVYMRQKYVSHVLISAIKGLDADERYYVISFGIHDDKLGSYDVVHIRRRLWNSGPWLARSDLRFATKQGRYNLFDDHVKLYKIDFKNNGFISLNIMNDGLWWKERYITYQDSYWKAFDAKFIGFGGGVAWAPTWWYTYGLARAWLPVYRGPCKPPPATMPTENPNNIREKMNIDLYNFAGRMDEFGYKYTRVWG